MPRIGIYIIVAASIYAAGFGSGWLVHGWKYDAAAKAETVALMERIRKQDAANRRLAKQFQEAQSATRIVYRTIEKRVKDETSNRACLSVGAVSLWNDALFGMSAPAAGTTGTTAPADPATDRDVLGNAVENMELYRECRDQLNALIDWHEPAQP